jgi:hypothetical protein
MSTDLSDAVAELIAQLPGDVNEMTVADGEAFYALRMNIAEAGMAAAEAIKAVIEPAGSRGCHEQSPVVEFLTGEERAALDRLMRRALDAERAQAALDAWEDRSGLAEFTLRMSGIPRIEAAVTLAEDPDGDLAFVRPNG